MTFFFGASVVLWWELLLIVPAVLFGTSLFGVTLWRTGVVSRNIPEFHESLVLFFGAIMENIRLTEGNHYLPRFLFLKFSTNPVGETKFVHHDESGKQETLNLGHFSDGEKAGAVFMGKRFFQALVTVQAKNKEPVRIDANFVMKVSDARKWKQADNPFGITLGLYETGLRNCISQFNGGDVNDVQSAIPTLFVGGSIFVVYCTVKRGDFNVGDLVRSQTTGLPIYKKILPGTRFTTSMRNTFLAELAAAYADCIPNGGFTEDHIVEVKLPLSIVQELHKIGGEHLSTQIEDVTQDESIEKAAAQATAAMKNRVQRLTDAETTRFVTEKLPKLSNAEELRRTEIALAQSGSASYVVGTGDNPIAQLAGALINERKLHE